MKTTITVSRDDMNPINLPGMGRSIELNGLSEKDNTVLNQAFSSLGLQVEFEEEKGVYYDVINLWRDPHTTQRLTLFI